MDRISNLPDEVIHHICSFLSTLEAAPTILLSKRWRTLFTQIPILIFDDRKFRGREQAFASFVNSVHAINTATNIRYHLRIRNPINFNYVKTWVQFAIDRNVKELHVDTNQYGTFEMPRCESVKNLRLNLENGTLNLPSTIVCFDSLETLSLSTVNFLTATYLSVTSQQFPRIKSLSLERCSRLTHLEVICPLLEEIEIVQCQNLEWLSISGEQIRSLSVHDSFTYGRISVRIFAPGLQRFKWLDYVVGDFRIGNFTSLKVAHVSLVVHHDPEHKELYLENATSFLNNLVSAGSLEVEMPCFWGLPTQKELLERLSTPPHNLKHLTLFVGLDDNVFRDVVHLLRSCPNLNTVKVRTVNEEIYESIMESFPEMQRSDGGEQWKYEDQPLNQLLEVEFCGFRGMRHDNEFMQFLLKNAPALKRMIILFSTKASLDQRMKFQTTVTELERSSPNAIVKFF